MSKVPKSDTLRFMSNFHDKKDKDTTNARQWNTLLHFMNAKDNPFRQTSSSTSFRYEHFLDLSPEVPIRRAAELLFQNNIEWDSTYNEEEKKVLLTILDELLFTLEYCLRNIKYALQQNIFPPRWSRDSTEQVLKKFTEDWVPLFEWNDTIWKLTPANQEGLTYYVLKRWLEKDSTNNKAWEQYKNILGNKLFIQEDKRIDEDEAQ